jgi:energy-coupling factor transporter ATP-binding protein EcfA2
MSVTVQNLSDETRSQVEPHLNQIFESSDVGDLALSPICAHVFLESARLLKEKKAEQGILSSSTIFLTAMLFSLRLAEEGLPDAEEGPGEELVGLQNWGLALHDSYREATQLLVGSLFATRPVPARNLFENLTEEPPSEIRIGPGLARTLNAAVESNVLTTPSLLLRLARDEESGIARRLREWSFEELTQPLLERDKRAPGPTDPLPSPEVRQSGRHARMFREAEEDELVLGVRDYAKAIATVLRVAKGEFTFALFGRWGSGKTTLVTQLEPLLRDAKSYQRAIGAPDGFGEHYARRSYRVVMHNAWKYRSRPEAWVYAYKSLAVEASRSFGPMGRPLLALRTSVYRRGIWPIAGSLMLLGLMALPLTAKLQLAVIALSLAGFSTLVYLGAVTTSVSGKVRALFAKHLRLTQVDERLGMLALIGDDVRALLAGWTKPLRGDDEDRSRRDFLPGRLVLPLLAILSVAALWAYGLLRSHLPVPKESNEEILTGLTPAGWAEAIGPLANVKPGPPSTGEWFVFGLWCLLAFGMLALPWLWRWGRPNRVLMVIDDLDRCTASEMLDVIEGMKLLVDDSTVNRRLQVLMLVDESVLDHAIAARYAAMIEERVSDLEGDARKLAREKAREEVIIEQNEKLFACHLRLAPLSRNDVEEVVARLAGREQRLRDLEAARKQLRQAQAAAETAERSYQSVLSGQWEQMSQGSPGGPDGSRPRFGEKEFLMNAEIADRNMRRYQQTPEERIQDRPEVVQARDEAARAVDAAVEGLRAVDPEASPELEGSAAPIFDDADVRFTASEIQDLRRQVPPFLEALNRQPSPRAIRILLFKVQLCRLLLQLRYPGEPSERTVVAILDAFKTVADSSKPSGPARVATTIARQVI